MYLFLKFFDFFIIIALHYHLFLWLVAAGALMLLLNGFASGPRLTISLFSYTSLSTPLNNTEEEKSLFCFSLFFLLSSSLCLFKFVMRAYDNQNATILLLLFLFNFFTVFYCCCVGSFYVFFFYF